MSVTSTPKPMPRGPTDDPDYLLFFLDARYPFSVLVPLDHTTLPSTLNLMPRGPLMTRNTFCFFWMPDTIFQ